MGKISQGILGGFSGKVGNVVGGNWKGIDYMRVKPSNVANPRSEGQVNQRTKFTTVLQFLQPLVNFVKVGFKDYAIKMTAFNSAMSYNLKNAVTGTAPDFSIDYANTLLSRGNLLNVLSPSITSSTPGEVNINWNNNADGVNSFDSDKSMIVIYNESNGEVVFTTNGTERVDDFHAMAVPGSYSGNTVHGFLAFITADGARVANSKYVGSVTVA